jgi:hypothetical protein
MDISIKFIATEAGFKNGLGGASNAKLVGKSHYILFGTQTDLKHPENSGIYFEYDSQSNGSINAIEAVRIGANVVAFKLKKGKSIEVQCNVSADEWHEFKRGIHTVFPQSSIHAT